MARVTLLSPEKHERVRLVDSQWFTQVSQGTNYAQNLERLKRWFPQGHPFDKELVVIPVCRDNHWVIAAAMLTEEQWLVTVLNSLEGPITTKVAQTITSLVQLSHPGTTVRAATFRVATQRNLVDCGLHVIHNGARLMHTVLHHPVAEWADLEASVGREPNPISREAVRSLLQALKDGDAVPREIIALLKGDAVVQSLQMALTLSDSEEEEVTSTTETSTMRGAGLRLRAGEEVTLGPGTTMINQSPEELSWDEVGLETLGTIANVAREGIREKGPRRKFLRNVLGKKVSVRVRGDQTILMTIRE